MNCYICNTSAKIGQTIGYYSIECPRCGTFSLGTLARDGLNGLSATQRASISGWIRERGDVLISEPDVSPLKNLKPLSVGEKGDRFLRWIGNELPKPGAIFDVDHVLKGNGNFLSAHLWAIDDFELRYVIRDYLSDEMGFLFYDPQVAEAKITPKGWAHLQSLQNYTGPSDSAFIAMWFDQSVDETFKTIEAAVSASGYKPIRVDKVHHNNKIDDEIIAAIRRSKFLIADFTGHRGGVYFEAGFALGLGKQVVWCCREDELKNTHFDNRQYNFIKWKPDDLEQFKSDLQNRIEATLGRGPIKLS